MEDEEPYGFGYGSSPVDLPPLLMNGFLTYYPVVQCSRVTPQLMPPRTLSLAPPSVCFAGSLGIARA